MATKKTRKKSQQKMSTFIDFESVMRISPTNERLFLQLFAIDLTDWMAAVERIRNGEAYRTSFISKGEGKPKRRIDAPASELKLIQSIIANRFLREIPSHFLCHGNKPGTSIFTNAEQHRGASYVLSADIVNAFPSVLRSRVRAILRKPFGHRLRQLPEYDSISDRQKQEMLEVMIDLLCFMDRLPQGSPASPRILELAMFTVAEDLSKLCFEKGYTASIYADNISISSTTEIEDGMVDVVRGIFKKRGFRIHESSAKTRIDGPSHGTTPSITGLVIADNDEITCSPTKLNNLRASLHNAMQVEDWDSEIAGKVAGTIGFLRQVYPKSMPSKVRLLVENCEIRLAERSQNV